MLSKSLHYNISVLNCLLLVGVACEFVSCAHTQQNKVNISTDSSNKEVNIATNGTNKLMLCKLRAENNNFIFKNLDTEACREIELPQESLQASLKLKNELGFSSDLLPIIGDLNKFDYFVSNEPKLMTIHMIGNNPTINIQNEYLTTNIFALLTGQSYEITTKNICDQKSDSGKDKPRCEYIANNLREILNNRSIKISYPKINLRKSEVPKIKTSTSLVLGDDLYRATYTSEDLKTAIELDIKQKSLGIITNTLTEQIDKLAQEITGKDKICPYTEGFLSNRFFETYKMRCDTEEFAQQKAKEFIEDVNREIEAIYAKQFNLTTVSCPSCGGQEQLEALYQKLEILANQLPQIKTGFGIYYVDKIKPNTYSISLNLTDSDSHNKELKISKFEFKPGYRYILLIETN